MNRRDFLKALTGGMIGVAIASVLPDSAIAKQVSKRHADILVDVDKRCYITIGKSQIEVDSLNLTIRHDNPLIRELGNCPIGYDPTPTTMIRVEHFSNSQERD